MQESQTANKKASSKKWLWIAAVIVVVLAALAAFVAPRIYAAKESSDVAAPSLSASPTSAQSAIPAGTWTVVQGAESEAGYRVDEVLNGVDVTVVGRTQSVSGEVVTGEGTVESAKIVVNLADVSTDSDRRDNYFRTRAIDTTVNPEATFTVTAPVSIDLAAGGANTVEVPGELSINGVTKQALVPIQVQQADGVLKVAGSVPVRWEDFGVTPPDMGFVTVEDQGAVEFLLTLNS